jgi:hypothetical protein
VYFINRRRIHKELNRITPTVVDSQQALVRAIPQLVAFKRREDHLLVKPNGDGILSWYFELRADPNESINELILPVYVEIPSHETIRRAILVEAIEVDGAAQETRGALQLIERRQPMDRPPGEPEVVEYEHLSIPVNLERGRDSCRVYVRVRMLDTFPHAFTMEPLFIDIPYFTEQLQVRIESEQHSVRLPLSEGTEIVTAMSSLMRLPDTSEAELQSALCQEEGRALIWRTDSAKLGYQYKIFFKLEAPES